MRRLPGYLILALWLVSALPAATFGRVVAIGGQASDIALDESRGLLYIANFTANRIEVMSLKDYSIRSSINVAPQPGALALSPDNQFLLVAHFGNWTAPNTPSNALTVINLNGNQKQTFGLGSPPLGVAFGIDGLAVVVTTNEFLQFDPISGSTSSLGSIAGITATLLPVETGQFPPNIVAAALAPSADGYWVYGLGDNFRFIYDVRRHQVKAMGYTSSPTMGPRTVSVARDGSYYTAGWGLFDAAGRLAAEFPNPTGKLNLGSHAVDSAAGLIYGQIPEAITTTTTTTLPGGLPTTATTVTTGPMQFQIMDADNLLVREKFNLAENLAGRSLLNNDSTMMYSVSDSGVTVFPVGLLKQQNRVAAQQEDLVFRANPCDRKTLTQSLAIGDPGGNRTDFSLSSTMAGVSFSPASGTTPAVVQVQVDPTMYRNQTGTASGTITLTSAAAVNIPKSVRVLINNRDPDQRGTVLDVPGKLVDLLADPVRDRFYVLRQDANEVQVYDGSTYQKIATLRTSNTPFQMAITFDRKYMLIAHNDSQLMWVYDLDTYQQQPPVTMPFGHYPRSIAASGNAILVASRVAGPVNTIDRVDMVTRMAYQLPSLGVFKNEIDVNTVLVAAPNGGSILIAMASGSLMLYNSSADTFTVARKDFTALSGSYAASSFDQYVVDNNLLNSSLVPVRKFDSNSGSSSGFAFVDNYVLRTVAPSTAAPGVIQRVDMQTNGMRPTRLSESPLLPLKEQAFTRTLAPLYSRAAIINLTLSGFTVLPWTYDVATPIPHIDSLVNAADLTKPVAPGGLVTIFGTNLSPVNLATSELPVPTALGESCLSVNGVAMPMLFVSSKQINAQMPYNVDGNATMVLRTPGGVSDNFNLNILPAAPSVFRSGVAGDQTGLPLVYRALNSELVTPTNPVHPGDTLIILGTGLGRMLPAIETGAPAPSDTPTQAVLTPSVTLGNVALGLEYAGLMPGQVGVFQINAVVPNTAPLGLTVPLRISQGGASTSLDVRVVK